MSASDVIAFPAIYESTANAVVGDLASYLNEAGLTFPDSPVQPKDMQSLQRRIADGTISIRISKELIKAKFEGEKASIDDLIEKLGLRQISDAGAIEKAVDEVLAKNAKQVEDYRAGKDKAFNSLVGQVMKATQGKANPAQVNEILKRKLAR
jgi:aspartyl-tRNA(Asn)/glutamyl-tRNA(Gln) amidotransferase subunit B